MYIFVALLAAANVFSALVPFGPYTVFLGGTPIAPGLNWAVAVFAGLVSIGMAIRSLRPPKA